MAVQAVAKSEASAARPLVEVRHVSHRYKKGGGGDLPVLDDVDIRLNENEIVGLLGRSGSGKSTLLRSIAGLLRPSDGQVLFRYVNADGQPTPDANPNGSMRNIAGICNAGRNVVGLMPHPERAMEPLLGSSDGRVLFESLLVAANA